MSSRSCRFSRSSSANLARSLIESGDSETGFASRYFATQLPSVPSWIRNSRATCAIGRPDSITSRTASSLNSGVYDERSLDSLAIVSSISIFRKELWRRLSCGRDSPQVELLEAWLFWARRSRIPSFVKLAKTITLNKPGIVATLTHRLSNARIEAINTTLRLICRRAYGFHSAQALIALAVLSVGGLRPALPGRE